jgi:hypothetical protein
MDNRWLATEIFVAGDTCLAVGQAMNRQMKSAGICPSPVLPDRGRALMELRSPPVGGARQTATSTNQKKVNKRS